MLKTGTIKNYQQDRGFGFINSDESGKDIFFHIKDFPKGMLPQIGERLTYSVVQDGHKTKAVGIVRLDYPSDQKASGIIAPERIVARSSKQSGKKSSVSSKSFFSNTISAILIFGLGYAAFNFFQNTFHRQQLAQQPVTSETLSQANTVATSDNSQNFKCDGRIHCSQMSSKAEADWFVRNCPGTKMDGDRDGDACENDSRW